MLLCEDIAEQRVLLESQLSEEQERTLLRFLFNNKDFSLGQQMISVVSTEMLLNIHSMWIHLSVQENKGFRRCLKTKLKVLGTK
jgi:hypothetical protein